MKITTDLSQVQALQSRAKEELSKVGQIMKSVTSFAAQYEKDNHQYINRTGNLEKSTQAFLLSDTAQSTRADLEMSMFYASYIVTKRLSEIVTVARDSQEEIEKQFAEMLKRIAK